MRANSHKGRTARSARKCFSWAFLPLTPTQPSNSARTTAIHQIRNPIMTSKIACSVPIRPLSHRVSMILMQLLRETHTRVVSPKGNFFDNACVQMVPRVRFQCVKIGQIPLPQFPGGRHKSLSPKKSDIKGDRFPFRGGSNKKSPDLRHAVATQSEGLKDFCAESMITTRGTGMPSALAWGTSPPYPPHLCSGFFDSV